MDRDYAISMIAASCTVIATLITEWLAVKDIIEGNFIGLVWIISFILLLSTTVSIYAKKPAELSLYNFIPTIPVLIGVGAGFFLASYLSLGVYISLDSWSTHPVISTAALWCLTVLIMYISYKAFQETMDDRIFSI